MIKRSKLALYLCGVWDKTASAASRNAELVLCAPGLRPPHDVSGWVELRLGEGEEDRQLRKDLAEQLTAVVKPLSDLPGSELVMCYLNDLYNYTLLPAIRMLVAIREHINELHAREVLVITAKGNGRGLPMLGFRTTESLRGSVNLLATRVASLLPAVFPHVSFNYHYVKGDWLCYEPWRRALLAVANVGFGVSLIVRSLWLQRVLRETPVPSSVRSVVLVRARHQVRFARRLLQVGGSSTSAIIAFPQATQGSIGELVDDLRSLPKEIGGCRLRVRDAVRAIRETLNDLALLKEYERRAPIATVNVSHTRIPIALADVAREIRLGSVALLYKNLLAQVLRRWRPERLVNFELVGRMAGLEALVARQNRVQTRTVQTALVSAVAHPLFPVSDRFYADSAATARLIRGIGCMRNGTVVYTGTPYEIISPRAIDRFRHIVFFSQPYEHEATMEILRAICQWCRQFEATVTLRVHPRDDVAAYGGFLNCYRDVAILDNASKLNELIQKSHVAVTRTSSIAKEAIAGGCPVILCLWTKRDRSVVADYIQRRSDLRYCAGSVEELHFLLDHPSEVSESMIRLQEAMFERKETERLARAVLAEAD